MQWPIAGRLVGPPGASISDAVIEALSGDLESGIGGLLSAWTALVVTAARSLSSPPRRGLPLGDGVAGIAVTSVAAKMSRIVAGVVDFGDPLGGDLLAVGADYGVPPRARGRGFDAWARARAGEGSRNRAPSGSGPCTRPA